MGESVHKPLEYYHNNITGTLMLCQSMREHGCKRIVFSSSATVYGMNNPVPFKEGMPTSATNPYGYTKVMIEQILSDLHTADPEWSVVLLRYFNPIGAHESGLIGEDPNGIPNNLLPYVSQVAIGKLPQLSVYGDDYDTPDGTGVRDYIHVVDLALGHLKAIDYSMAHTGVEAINLGAPACWRLSTPSRRPAATKSPTRLWAAARATSPPATPTPARPKSCWVGRPPAASRKCAGAAGTLSRKIQTDCSNL